MNADYRCTRCYGSGVIPWFGSWVACACRAGAAMSLADEFDALLKSDRVNDLANWTIMHGSSVLDALRLLDCIKNPQYRMIVQANLVALRKAVK